jgi:hypothetical protein
MPFGYFSLDSYCSLVTSEAEGHAIVVTCERTDSGQHISALEYDTGTMAVEHPRGWRKVALAGEIPAEM